MQNLESMTVNTPAAYGMYSYDAELHWVVDALSQSGFEKEAICMMVSPAHPIARLVREANILNAEPKDGAATEGFIGWLFEFGAVVIPTVGVFIRSRAFLHALMAWKDSPILCGGSRALLGLRFSQHDAERYENQLRDIGVLVYVACSARARAAWAV